MTSNHSFPARNLSPAQSDIRNPTSEILPHPICTGHYIGLDLGQAHGHTAIAVLERLPLGMDYPSMVQHVRTLVQRPELAQSPATLVVDATGVGRAVVDLLPRASLPCRVIPVTITAGDKETCESIMWNLERNSTHVLANGSRPLALSFCSCSFVFIRGPICLN